MTKETQSASTNTIRLHRVLRAAPEKVYRAFLDAEAMAKWLPPTGLSGPFPIEILARVAAQMGEPDRAIAALQKLLSIPYAGAVAAGVPLTPCAAPARSNVRSAPE